MDRSDKLFLRILVLAFACSLYCMAQVDAQPSGLDRQVIRLSDKVSTNSTNIALVDTKIAYLTKQFDENKENNTWWFRSIGIMVLGLVITRIGELVVGRKVRIGKISECPYSNGKSSGSEA